MDFALGLPGAEAALVGVRLDATPARIELSGSIAGGEGHGVITLIDGRPSALEADFAGLDPRACPRRCRPPRWPAGWPGS
ncbi:MAG: hypothetical protein R3F43_03315 [bacterium]